MESAVCAFFCMHVFLWKNKGNVMEARRIANVAYHVISFFFPCYDYLLSGLRAGLGLAVH